MNGRCARRTTLWKPSCSRLRLPMGEEAANKVRYLLSVLAATPSGQDSYAHVPCNHFRAGPLALHGE
jgi:hypothetical protein